jgi:hypothetical protein
MPKPLLVEELEFLVACGEGLLSSKEDLER